MSRHLLPAALAVAAVAALAGCGGGSKPSAASPAATHAARSATVATRHTPLGTILVDAHGRTLYLFEKDKGATSTCFGACAAAWPPLTTAGKAVAGQGAAAADVGAAKRKDGTSIVTYDGHPLYTYAGDAAPGDTTGQGLDQFGAEWYAVAPSGEKVDDD